MNPELSSFYSGAARPSSSSRTAVSNKLNQLTKPPGSLGQLEELVLWLGACQGTDQPQAKKKRILVAAGDHGVTQEGVSPYPSSVTGQMVENMLAGGAAISVLAKQAQAELILIDAGVADDLSPHPNLLIKKTKKGTANLAQGPAMSSTDCLAALQEGLALAATSKQEGVDILAIGEMGIGNSTPAAALYCSLLGLAPSEIAGRGTGLDDAGVLRKQQVIAKALALHQAQLRQPLDHLQRLGGFEIALLTGICLGAAKEGIPLVVDGFISAAAALVALKLEPQTKDWLLFSHSSAEGGHPKALRALGVKPLLHLDLRLGEGTGAALALLLLDQALALYEGMATFAGAGVDEQKEP